MTVGCVGDVAARAAECGTRDVCGQAGRCLTFHHHAFPLFSLTRRTLLAKSLVHTSFILSSFHPAQIELLDALCYNSISYVG
jgi:hypothetical protein